MPQLPVYILAGGHSKRFGSDKARAIAAGEMLIVRVADALKPVASRLTVIADVPEKYADLGLNTIADRLPELGPLGGLHAAVCAEREHYDEGWILLAACDLARVNIAWIDDLLAVAKPGDRAIAFCDKHWEPLLALYHTSIARALQRCIDDECLSMQKILKRIGAVAVPLPDDWPAISQINTPEDLQAFLRGGG
jgi:molybdopterin-guanine dinucleotide biosynthesis protein A